MALLQLSLQEGPVCLEKRRCVCNPFKKCRYLTCQGPGSFALPAAASVLLVYYKLCDNIADEGPLKSLFYRLLRQFLKKAHRKAAADFPLLEQSVAAYLAAQQQVEQAKAPGVDAAAEPTGKMLSALFAACDPGGEQQALQRLGYCMGRWIYLTDAAADLKKDLKKNRFNPLAAEFAGGFSQSRLKARVLPLLNISAAEAAGAFEQINIKRFKNILGNIIYMGLQNSAAHLFQVKENTK